MLRWLLQRFQEGVEGFGRQHVHFVDDVDFAFAHAWREAHLLANVADLINAAVGRRINFDYVEKTVLIDGTAVFTDVTRFAVLRVQAIDGFRENFRGARFAGAARPAKKIGMGESMMTEGAQKRLGNGILANQRRKGLRPVDTV